MNLVERKKYTENEKMLLHTEVQGRCPFCGIKLVYQKKDRIHKGFEIAHIYPVKPTYHEMELLKDEERLSDDVNDLKNVMAVCSTCHQRFDTPRTIEEYRNWVSLKTKIMQNTELKNYYTLFNLEDEIKVVLEKLNSEIVEGQLVRLSYDSLKIDMKTNASLPFAIKRLIKQDVVDYFNFIRILFIDINTTKSFKFETIASEIKSFYRKCMQINQNQELVYNSIVDWMNEKTNFYSRRACEIIIAYFIQDCEVFE